jgi:uncharacterized protein with von Willebrand factor type A (vWA) domain
MSLLEKAKRLVGRGRPKLATSAVDRSKIEGAILRDMRKRAPVLNDAITTPPESATAASWDELANDVWSTYFGEREPRLRPRDEMDPAYHVNREVVNRHIRSEEYENEHPRTAGKPVPSALGCVGALNSLRESYENELKEHADRAKEVEQAQDDLDRIDEYLSELRETRELATPEGQEEIDEKIREAANEKRTTLSHLREQREQQRTHAADMAKAVRVAVEKAHAAAADAVDAAEMLPGVGKGAGSGSTANADAMFTFAEKIRGNATLRRVLEMMGRLDLSMGSTRRTMRKGGFEDIVDIEFGAEMPVVLAHEKALIRHPIGRLDFFRRFQERALMQYETVEERELKRGPCIFVNDGSASMKGVKNILARGLTLSTVNMMHRERRNTAAIEFGGPGQARCEFFPKDRPLDVETMIRFAEQFYNGGTSTLTGMRMALDLIKREAPFHSADLIIVTDGEDVVTPEDIAIRDELRAMGVKLHGIAVGLGVTNYLLNICDVTTSVTEFTHDKNQASDRLAIELT